MRRCADAGGCTASVSYSAFRISKETAMSIYRSLGVFTILSASRPVSAPAAMASAPPDPGESRTQPAQTSAVIDDRLDPEPLSGENALGYLSALGWEELARARAGTDVSDYPAGSIGTSSGTLSAAQRGAPVRAGGTNGGFLSPFALATMR